LLIELSIIVLIMAVSDTLATLKTIFVSKKIFLPVYFMVFINAVIFILVISKVATTEEGIYYALAFAAGKTLGVYFGGKVESKMALGIMEVNVFFNNSEKMASKADEFREKGFSVNTHDVHGLNGKKRYIIEITLRRNDLKRIRDIMMANSEKEPTMTIKEVSSVYGKIRKGL